MPGIVSEIKDRQGAVPSIIQVKTETTISVCYRASNDSRLIHPFLQELGKADLGDKD